MLMYPLAEAPVTGQTVDLAPGVRWLRIPMDSNPDSINVWALDDGDGLALIDTGMSAEICIKAWRAAFAGPLSGRKVKRVFVTHLHPDHIGLAGLFTRSHHCRLWITRLEFLTCRSLAADTGLPAPADALDFYRAAGWNDEMLESYRARFGFFGKSLHALPDSFIRMRDGDEISIGDYTWRVVVGSGHSPEHACFYCPELKLFISGDQVLPQISSNVAVYPTEPEADPLAEWLTSLARIRDLVPNDVLVLPAHNNPFHGLHERIGSLIEGHRKGLERLLALLTEPCRVTDCFRALFRKTIDDSNRLLATGECLSHLNHLIGQGLAVRECDADGVAWYRAL